MEKPTPIITYHRPSHSPLRLTTHKDKIERYDLSTANTYKKYLAGYDEPPSSRQTRRKRYEPQASSLEALIEKNKNLSSENAQLYRLLEERGRIIVVLEKKLQTQAIKRGVDQSAMRNKDSLKISQYQQQISKLKRQISQLRIKNMDQKGHLLDQFLSFNKSTDQERHIHERQLQTDLLQLTKQEGEAKHLKALLNLKTLELEEITKAYTAQIDCQKAQLSILQAQLADLKIKHHSQLSELRMSYEHKLDNCARQRIHQMQVTTLQHSLEVKQLTNIVQAKNQELQRLKSSSKTDKAEVGRKYQELISNNDKLQAKIQQVQEQYKKNIQDELQKLKQLHRSEINSIIAKKDAMILNLQATIRKEQDVSSSKSREIEALNQKVKELTMYSANQAMRTKSIIEELKGQICKIELDQLQLLKREKIKHEELKNADITALKDFYEHQIKMLNCYLHEQMELNERQKNNLYQEIDQKAEMRKIFDLEVEDLSLRIRELQGTIRALQLERNQQLQQMSQKLQMATELYHRQNQCKDNFDANSDKEIKNLQQLITNKDKQIQQLSLKIQMIKENNSIQMKQKDSQIDRLRKSIEEIENKTKKQKYLFENEIKKKQISIKNNKNLHEAEIQRLKQSYNQQCQSLAQQLDQLKAKTEQELQQLKISQKRLKRQLQSLIESKRTEIQSNSHHLTLEVQRLLAAKKQDGQQRVVQHNQQKKKMEREINQLKKKLSYKEEDLRNMSEKYHRLQQKLTMVVDNQEKLKSIENKMNIIGEENNYVKHLAQVIKQKQQT